MTVEQAVTLAILVLEFENETANKQHNRAWGIECRKAIKILQSNRRKLMQLA